MGQFQNVPGPSQDEFNAQTQAIANLQNNLMPVSYATLTNVSDFENYLVRGASDGGLVSGGTAQANLQFTGNIVFEVYGNTTNMHVMLWRANGELYTRNKNNGTWDSEWVKRW